MSDTSRFDTLKGIVEIYLPEDVSPSEITGNSNMISELNINSANLVDIILDVEDAFGITLENKDMDQMQTIGDALRIVDQKLSEKK